MATLGGSNGHDSAYAAFMDVAMNLRPATPADLELLRRWDEQVHVIASDPNDDWAWDVELGRFPDWRGQFIAEVDGRPVGFVQITTLVLTASLSG